MNKEKAKQQLEALMKEAEKLQAIINAPEKALRLEVNIYNSLCVLYGKDYIGFIDIEGKCHILNDKDWVDAYNQWRKDKMPVDSTPVKWRGNKYSITEDYALKCDSIEDGYIYDFNYCGYASYCGDDNIQRFEHNLKAIGF